MTREKPFFEGWSWFKFNNLGLEVGMDLKFYTSVALGFKLKDRKICGLILKFVEFIEEELVRGPFLAPPILNRVKASDEIESWRSINSKSQARIF